jgi:hypothetical protein
MQSAIVLSAGLVGSRPISGISPLSRVVMPKCFRGSLEETPLAHVSDSIPAPALNSAVKDRNGVESHERDAAAW